MSAGTYPEGWFDEFWEGMEPGPDVDDGISAVRLVGELLASEGIWRDGDDLIGRQGAKVALSPNDQHLVRRIEAAVERARDADPVDES